MKNKKIIITSIVIVLFTLLIVWRLWKKDVYDMINMDKKEIKHISVVIVKPEVSDGKSRHITYYLKSNSNEKEFDKIFSVLEKSKFRSSFLNLLPEGVGQADYSKNNIKYSASISLYDKKESSINNISFVEENKVMVSSYDENKVYYTTNKKILEMLYNYVSKYGEKED